MGAETQMVRQRGRPEPARTAVALLRVSTDRERQELGVEAQRQAIAAWASREGVTLLGEHLDEVSGGAPIDERPGLLAALAAVEVHRASLLVVHRIDRLSRDPLSAALIEAQLQRCGATVACAEGAGSGDDPTSELVRAVLVAVGRFERKVIAARIRAALAVKRGRGEALGRHVRYGYRRGPDGVHLEPEPDEQATITRALELQAEGRSVRAVVAALAGEGRLSRSGKPFTLSSMQAILAGSGPR